MTLQDKLAIGIEQLLGVAEYGICSDYTRLTETWRDERQLPLENDILDAFEVWETTSREAIRTALWQQWDALPAWINGPYRPLFDAANRLLDENQDEAAFEMIDAAEPTSKMLADLDENENPITYPALGGLTKAQYFAAVKTQFAAAIENFYAN